MSQPQSTQSNLASWPFVDSLYEDLLRRGVDHFFPEGRLETIETGLSHDKSFVCAGEKDVVSLQWLGRRSSLFHPGGLTGEQIRLLEAIGRTLAVRYEALSNTTTAAQSLQLFRGLPEDHYVSAFLDPKTYASIEALSHSANRIAAAIEVLRVSALTTYENRRITTGALLFGRMPDPCHAPPPELAEALPYSGELTPSRSFFRLCDGLRTLALIDTSGRLTELIDVREWTEPYRNLVPPVPVPTRYREHCRATLCGGHVCLVLTPAGEIKIFADGAQLFRLSDGKWRLTDAREKYRTWEQAVGDRGLASRLFQVALDMAEDRRGGLFVVLDDAEIASHLLQPEDLLSSRTAIPEGKDGSSRRAFHYLVQNKRVLDVAPSVVESLAHIDGAVVLDSRANLLAFGAIIQPRSGTPDSLPVEGGRTTAAMLASRFGKALKISEDGVVCFYEDGRCNWEI